MSRERLVEMARRNLAHHEAGTTHRVESIARVPASNYFDAQRWQREVDLVFRRLPLALGLTAELPEPHGYKAIEVLGMPVLLSRGGDGVVRAFVNMCSHRGSMLMEEGCGSARRFTCPYHGWSYDPSGELVGIFRQADFGELDHAELGLTPLPVAERAGIIWVILSPGIPGVTVPLDIDTFLGDYGELLGCLRLEEMFHYGHRVLAGPNWKVAFDGYVDFYHLPVLHKNTFGEQIPPHAVFHFFGPHQRIVGPSERAAKLQAKAEADWTTEDLVGGVWSIFPHGSVAGFDVGGARVYQVARIFPGATATESVTHLDFVSLDEPTEELRARVDKQIDFLLQVVRDEDYHTGLKIQRTLPTGVRRELFFGRNEGGAQHVHGWIDRVLNTPDAELKALFVDT